MTVDKIHSIVSFWFEGIDDNTAINKNRNPFKKWFVKDLAFDKEIKDRFEGDLNNAMTGKYKDWESEPKGVLALILLYDQITRNMYRDTAQMYKADMLAQSLSKQLIVETKDSKLDLIQRVFIYMPLMHAEDIISQDLSVKSFNQLVEESEKKYPQNVHYYQYNLSYANKYHTLIARFGRFPHRNKVLERISTQQELEVLQNRSTKV